MQQLQGQFLKRDPGPGVQAGLAEEVGDVSGVPGLAPRVHVLEGPEVVVQGVAHHHLALQELEDLSGERSQEGPTVGGPAQGVQIPLQGGSTDSGGQEHSPPRCQVRVQTLYPLLK